VTSSDDHAVEGAHRCQVPPLEAGERWTCPVMGCGQQYGQTFAPQPPAERVNVGFLLHELAEAFIEGGHSCAPGTPPRVMQNAMYRIGGQLERTARVFANTDVLLPVEQPRD